jgi:predicted kinase
MKPLSVTKPHLIIMVGIPGSGKSFFAEHFADTFKSPIISYDNLRNKISNSPNYSNGENNSVRKIANYILNETLKTGRTIIFDGQSDTRIDRAQISKLARDAGYEPLIIWVQTELLTAKKRSTKLKDSKYKTNPEKFDQIYKQFNNPQITEKAVVISGKHTYSSQLKIVLKSLAEPRIVVPEPTSTPTVRTPKLRNYLIR